MPEINLPEVPENLNQLSDDELAALRETLLAAEQAIYDGDEETVGDASNEDVLAAYEAVHDAILSVNSEIETRATEQQAVADRMAELRSEVREPEQPPAEGETPPNPEEDGEQAPAEGEPAEGQPAETEGQPAEAKPAEREAVVASSRPFRTRRRIERESTPVATGFEGIALTAAADVPGFASGAEIDRLDLARAMISRRRAFVQTPKGYRERVIVASAQVEYPEDRTLTDEDPMGMDKILAAVGRPGSHSIESITAAGGICAPTDVRYAWDVLGVTDTPVWDALPKFGAPRGGIRFPVIPTIADITTAITTVTAAQDAAGGTSAVKDCQEVTCPSFDEVLVDIVARCLEFPNLTARTYPEMVAGWNELLGIAFAQELEAKILTAIKALSLQPTAFAEGTNLPADFGSIANLFPALLQAAAQMRNHMRLAADAALRVLVPSWVLDNLVADWHRQHSLDALENTRQMFRDHFAEIGLVPTFYLDGSSDGAQMFAAATGGGVFPAYPANAEVFMYPEGTFLGIDSGTLDLGVVRDSSLNSSNKYQVFAEQFLNVAKTGGLSYRIAVPISPTGARALDKTSTFATAQ